MKKFLAIVLSLGAYVSTVYAQTSQGSVMIGGSVSYTSTKNESSGEDTKISEIDFTPSAGYFVADNLAVGLDLSVGTWKRDNGNGIDRASTIEVGPFVRYYIFTSNEKFAFYGDAGFRFGSGKTEPDGADEIKNSRFTFAISPGFSYFFSERWALDLELAGISYQTTDPNKDRDDDKTSTFVFGVDSFNPSLGFRYFIGK